MQGLQDGRYTRVTRELVYKGYKTVDIQRLQES